MDSRLHARLDRLVGTWRTEGVVVDGGEHDGLAWGGHDVYEWFPGGNVLAHRVDVEIFGGRKEGLELFTARAGSTEEFDQTSYDADGSVEHAVGSFDDRDRYVNDAGEARATLTFEGADRMSTLWERRLDDGTWIDWMRVGFTRVGDPHVEVRSKDDHTV